MCVEQGTIWTPRKNSQGLWRCHLRLLNSCTDTLGIKWSRARSIWLSRYVREGRIAERPHVKADNGIRDCLNEILNENWLLTLTQLNKRLWQCLSQIPEICDRTVAEELRTNAVSYKTGQACSCAIKKPSWCHSEATGLYHLAHGPCCAGPHCLHRRMWLQYLDCKKNEVTVEQEEGNGPKDLCVVSQEEMLLSQWPFHPTMFWFSTLQLLLGWKRKDLMTSLHKQD